MASTTAQEQTKQDIELSKQPGTQRVQVSGMVDKSQYITFDVPEWFIALGGLTNWTDPVLESATLWQAKESTKEVQRQDEANDAGTPTTTGKKIQRREADGGGSDGTSFSVYRQVKLILKPGHGQKKADKEYKTRSIRIPTTMNTRAIQYFLALSPVKNTVTNFKIGKTTYPVKPPDGGIASLGTLRSRTAASTVKA